MARYRNRLQIIAEILEIVRNGAKKTHIMYRANLSYKLVCKYLNDVVECGLARIDKADRYVVAPRGEKFLRRFEEPACSIDCSPVAHRVEQMLMKRWNPQRFLPILAGFSSFFAQRE